MTGPRVGRLVWAMSLPIVFAEIGETLVHATDTFFLGRVGTGELGAIALADSVFEIWTVLAIGVVEGVQILVARRAGEGNKRAVGATFARGVLLLAMISIALTASLKWASPRLASWMAESTAVARPLDDFLQIAAYGIAFYSVGLAFAALYVGLERTRVLVGATLVLAVTNVVLDYLLIFGKAGLPELGIKGAAAAFVGSEAAALAFLIAYAWRKRDVRTYGLFHAGKGDRGVLRGILTTSSPVAGEALVEALRWLAFFLIVEEMGDRALAASSIGYACFALLLIPSEAFSETACSLVSRWIGGGKQERILALARSAVVRTYAATLPFVALALLAPGLALSVLTEDNALASQATPVIRTAALVVLVVVPAQIWFAALVGTGSTRQALWIEIALALVTLSGAYMSAVMLGHPPSVVWLWVAAGYSLALTLSRHSVRGGRWQHVEI